MSYSTQDLLNLASALEVRLKLLRDLEHELRQAGAQASVEGLRSLLAAKLPPNYVALCNAALDTCQHFGMVERPREVTRLKELASAGLALAHPEPRQDPDAGS